MSRGTKPVVGFAVAVVLLMPFLATTAASATPAVSVSCGDTITRDTKLMTDLVDCPRHGIIIGAPNITLDLNGHTIDGDGVLFEPCPEDEPCDVGVANSGIRNGVPFNGNGFPGVTIKNGIVHEFAEVGVYITGTTGNVVRGVRTSTSDFESDGVHLVDCTHCRIEDSSASGYAVGMAVVRSADVEVV